MIKELRKAALIARRTFNVVEKLLKEGEDLYNIAEKAEEYIRGQNANPAFPINLSINEIAAHYTPNSKGNIIRCGDVIKVDLGVEIDGWIIDTARTYEICDTKYKSLIEASKEALYNAVRIIKKGITISEIGSVIENTIEKYGYKPIYNLTGHKIERYLLHAGMNIPNFNNKSKKILDNGIYAIEPFATTGIGYVIDYKPSGIYSFVQEPRVRIPKLKRFAEELYRKYRTLPFAKRWIIREFPNINVNLYLNYLKKLNILYEYSILKEQSNGIVSQWETTIMIDNKVIDFMGEEKEE